MTTRMEKVAKGLVKVEFDIPAVHLGVVSDLVRALGGTEHEDESEETVIPLREAIPRGHPGILLRALRRKEGLSQKDLADKLGTQQPNISSIEKGERVIGKELAKKIEKIFGTNYRVFL